MLCNSFVKCSFDFGGSRFKCFCFVLLVFICSCDRTFIFTHFNQNHVFFRKEEQNQIVKEPAIFVICNARFIRRLYQEASLRRRQIQRRQSSSVIKWNSMKVSEGWLLSTGSYLNVQQNRKYCINYYKYILYHFVDINTNKQSICQ